MALKSAAKSSKGVHRKGPQAGGGGGAGKGPPHPRLILDTNWRNLEFWNFGSLSLARVSASCLVWSKASASLTSREEAGGGWLAQLGPPRKHRGVGAA